MKDDLSNRHIEEKIKKAIERITPDIKSKIFAKMNNKNDKPFLIVQNKKTKNLLLFYRIFSAAAMLILVSGILFLLLTKKKTEETYAVVDIDVNPSIELEISKNDRIIEVKAINEDAEIILDGMDLEGTQTKVAINAIMGSMLEHGYLKDETRYVLISVDGKNDDAEALIEERIAKEMDTILENYSVEAQVITQKISDYGDESLIADNYGISQGKATLIKHIIALDSSYYEDELSLMSISELDALLTEIENSYLASYEKKETFKIGDVQNSIPVQEDSLQIAGEEIGISSVSENELDVQNNNNDTVSENSVSHNSVSQNMIDNFEENADDSGVNERENKNEIKNEEGDNRNAEQPNEDSEIEKENELEEK